MPQHTLEELARQFGGRALAPADLEQLARQMGGTPASPTSGAPAGGVPATAAPEAEPSPSPFRATPAPEPVFRRGSGASRAIPDQTFLPGPGAFARRMVSQLFSPVEPVREAARGAADIIDPGGRFREQPERPDFELPRSLPEVAALAAGLITGPVQTAVEAARAVPPAIQAFREQPAAAARGFAAGIVEGAGELTPLDALFLRGGAGAAARRTAPAARARAATQRAARERIRESVGRRAIDDILAETVEPAPVKLTRTEAKAGRANVRSAELTRTALAKSSREAEEIIERAASQNVENVARRLGMPEDVVRRLTIDKGAKYKGRQKAIAEQLSVPKAPPAPPPAQAAPAVAAEVLNTSGPTSVRLAPMPRMRKAAPAKVSKKVGAAALEGAPPVTPVPPKRKSARKKRKEDAEAKRRTVATLRDEEGGIVKKKVATPDKPKAIISHVRADAFGSGPSARVNTPQGPGIVSKVWNVDGQEILEVTPAKGRWARPERKSTRVGEIEGDPTAPVYGMTGDFAVTTPNRTISSYSLEDTLPEQFKKRAKRAARRVRQEDAGFIQPALLGGLAGAGVGGAAGAAAGEDLEERLALGLTGALAGGAAGAALPRLVRTPSARGPDPLRTDPFGVQTGPMSRRAFLGRGAATRRARQIVELDGTITDRAFNRVDASQIRNPKAFAEYQDEMIEASMGGSAEAINAVLKKFPQFNRVHAYFKVAKDMGLSEKSIGEAFARAAASGDKLLTDNIPKALRDLIPDDMVFSKPFKEGLKEGAREGRLSEAIHAAIATGRRGQAAISSTASSVRKDIEGMGKAIEKSTEGSIRKGMEEGAREGRLSKAIQGAISRRGRGTEDAGFIQPTLLSGLAGAGLGAATGAAAGEDLEERLALGLTGALAGGAAGAAVPRLLRTPSARGPDPLRTDPFGTETGPISRRSFLGRGVATRRAREALEQSQHIAARAFNVAAEASAKDPKGFAKYNSEISKALSGPLKGKKARKEAVEAKFPQFSPEKVATDIAERMGLPKEVLDKAIARLSAAGEQVITVGLPKALRDISPDDLVLRDALREGIREGAREGVRGGQLSKAVQTAIGRRGRVAAAQQPARPATPAAATPARPTPVAPSRAAPAAPVPATAGDEAVRRLLEANPNSALARATRAATQQPARPPAGSGRIGPPPRGVEPDTWTRINAIEREANRLINEQGVADVRLLGEMRNFWGAAETARRVGLTGRAGTQRIRELTQGPSRQPITRLADEMDRRYQHLINDPSGFMRVEALLAGTGAAAGGLVGATIEGESVVDRAANAISGALIGGMGGVVAGRGARALGNLAQRRGADAVRAVETIDTANLLAGPAAVKASFGALSGVASGIWQRLREGRTAEAQAALRFMRRGAPNTWFRVLTAKTDDLLKISTPKMGEVTAELHHALPDKVLVNVLRPFIAADQAGIRTLRRAGFSIPEARRLMLAGEPTSWQGQAILTTVNSNVALRMLMKFPRVRVVGLERAAEFTPVISKRFGKTVRVTPETKLSPSATIRGAQVAARRAGEPLSEAGRRARAEFGGAAFLAGTAYGFLREPGLREGGIAAAAAGPAFIPASAGLAAGRALRRGKDPLIELLAQVAGEVPQIGEADIRRLGQRVSPLGPLRRAFSEDPTAGR